MVHDAPCHGDIWANEDLSPLILNLGNRYRYG